MKDLKAALYALVLLTAMAFLNPDPSAHRAAIKDAFLAKGSNPMPTNASAVDMAGYSMGSAVVDRMIEQTVKVDNYYVFSLTKLSYQGSERNVGVGILGKVFLYGV